MLLSSRIAPFDEEIQFKIYFSPIFCHNYRQLPFMLTPSILALEPAGSSKLQDLSEAPSNEAQSILTPSN